MDVIFLDTETTDLVEPRLVQLAYKHANTGVVVNQLFKPPIDISYGAMATHHITNEMVVNKPVFVGSKYQQELIDTVSGGIVVAHNAPFDIATLQNEGVTVGRSIDTLRVAQHILLSPQYSLQYLRYSLHLNVVAAAHDALGDVIVLEALFQYLKIETKNKSGITSDDAVIQKMEELTQTPILVETFTFGKYIGKSFADVFVQDRGYLEWLFASETKKNPAEQNQTLVYTLKYYLKLP